MTEDETPDSEYQLGIKPNTLGIVTLHMYCMELINAFGPPSLIYALPISFWSGRFGFTFLKRDILAREDEVTKRFWELQNSFYKWARYSHPSQACGNKDKASMPPSLDDLLALTLKLATDFNGDGMRYAIAHYLAPSLVSVEHRRDHKRYVADFAEVVLSWNNKHTNDFLRLLNTEFVSYSRGVSTGGNHTTSSGASSSFGIGSKSKASIDEQLPTI